MCFLTFHYFITHYLIYIGFYTLGAHPIPYVTTPSLHYSDFGWPISGLIVVVLQHLYGTTTAAAHIRWRRWRVIGDRLLSVQNR